MSTHRVHSRGPVGVEGLLIYKYRLYGRGHVVDDYSGGEKKRKYLHNDIGGQRRTRRLPARVVENIQCAPSSGGEGGGGSGSGEEATK